LGIYQSDAVTDLTADPMVEPVDWDRTSGGNGSMIDSADREGFPGRP